MCINTLNAFKNQVEKYTITAHQHNTWLFRWLCYYGCVRSWQDRVFQVANLMANVHLRQAVVVYTPIRTLYCNKIRALKAVLVYIVA